MDIKITGEPIFLVLPSIFVYRFMKIDNYNYAILDPHLGKYTINCQGIITRDNTWRYPDHNIRINGKLYYPIGSDRNTVHIFDVQDNKIITTLSSPDVNMVYYSTPIKYPIFMYKGKGYGFVLTNGMQFTKFNCKFLEPHKYITVNGRIIHCDDYRICESEDNESYFLLKDKKLIRYYWNKDIFVDYKLDIPYCSSDPILLDDSHIYYTNEESEIIINTRTRQISSRSFQLNDKFSRTCSINGPLFEKLTREKDKVIYIDKLSNIKSTLDFSEISTTLVEITNSIGHVSFHKINEKPFKTPERDRLAQYLYEQFQKILPFGIAGIITDYCTLVKYYDYEVLMNWIKSQSESI